MTLNGRCGSKVRSFDEAREQRQYIINVHDKVKLTITWRRLKKMLPCRVIGEKLLLVLLLGDQMTMDQYPAKREKRFQFHFSVTVKLISRDRLLASYLLTA